MTRPVQTEDDEHRSALQPLRFGRLLCIPKNRTKLTSPYPLLPHSFLHPLIKHRSLLVCWSAGIVIWYFFIWPQWKYAGVLYNCVCLRVYFVIVFCRAVRSPNTRSSRSTVRQMRSEQKFRCNDQHSKNTERSDDAVLRKTLVLLFYSILGWRRPFVLYRPAWQYGHVSCCLRLHVDSIEALPPLSLEKLLQAGEKREATAITSGWEVLSLQSR